MSEFKLNVEVDCGMKDYIKNNVFINGVLIASKADFDKLMNDTLVKLSKIENELCLFQNDEDENFLFTLNNINKILLEEE